MSEVRLPSNWIPRSYQRDLSDYMFDGGVERKRAVCVWHRRAGKDSFCLNFGAVVSQVKVGTIWHLLPTLNQGRRVIWDGIDKYGRRMIDQSFPKAMRKSVNNSDMQIKLTNGSIWQVVGSDNYDSLVGTNPIGVIFSEYSVADPLAWEYIRPILAENGGWALFIYTPRGRNHGHKLFEMSQQNPKWYSSILTIEDTYDNDGETHIVSPALVEEERASGMAEEKIQQEFFCSWDSGLEGAFYTSELNDAKVDGRIGIYPHDPSKLCYTFWDIGFRDHTCIIIVQEGADGHPIVIDFLTGRNKSLAQWIKEVHSLKYNWAEHWGPHDLDQTDYITGKTRTQAAAQLGFDFEIVPKIPVEDGIDAGRYMLMTAKIDQNKCDSLLNGLYSYRREYDDKLQKFKDKPYHDWASNPADAWRYLSVAWENCAKSRVWTSQKKREFKQNHRVKSAMDGWDEGGTITTPNYHKQKVRSSIRNRR